MILVKCVASYVENALLKMKERIKKNFSKKNHKSRKVKTYDSNVFIFSLT